jgi:hypothetical protein
MVGQTMKKLLIKLLLLLAITVLIGKIVISKEHQEREFQEEEFMEEIDDFLILSDTYIFAQSNPVYIKSTPLGAKLPEKSYMELIRQYEWDSNVAYAVMMAESSGIADKINPHDYHRRAGCYGSYGLFQMGCIHFGHYGLTKDNWSDPETNVKAAYLLWKERWWNEWGAYRNKSYLKHL